MARGRKKFEPTKEQRDIVKALTGFGIPQDQIRLLIENEYTGKPISEQTLRVAFRHEINTGKVTADAKVVKNLYQIACGSGPGAVTAAIWWTKTRMRWRETVNIEHEEKINFGNSLNDFYGSDDEPDPKSGTETVLENQGSE